MKETHMTIPLLFRCPISLDLFTDPVTLCTGQTYDRPSIQKWLSAGNLTCPVTMQKLHDTTLVPNHTLRHLIQQWLQMGTDHDVHPDYLKIIGSLALLKHKLESHQTTLDHMLPTLQQIRLLLEESPPRDFCLVQLGFLPLLLQLLFYRVDPQLSHDYEMFAEQSLYCILRLLDAGETEALNTLKTESGLGRFVVLFEQGTRMIKKSLCHLVELISASSETQELCALMGKSSRLLRETVRLLQQNPDTSEAGIRAITALCTLETNRGNLVKAGVINGLLTHILIEERSERSLAPVSVARIEQLLGIEGTKQAIIENENGVNALVKMVFRVSDHEGSESAVNCLGIICQESFQARERAIMGGVLSQLLLLLQSQCSARTKTKARMLLKLLRSKWSEEQTHV